MNAHYFDLSQTEVAYFLGGKKVHWTDYSISDTEWDEDLYYADFDTWWDGLPDDEQNRIYNLMSC